MRASRGHSGTLHSAPTGLSHEFLLTPVVGMGVMTNSIMFLGRVNVFHVASQSREVGHVHFECGMARATSINGVLTCEMGMREMEG